MQKLELLPELAAVIEGKVGEAAENAARAWWENLTPEQQDQLKQEWSEFQAVLEEAWEAMKERIAASFAAIVDALDRVFPEWDVES
jgi:hypothetical protein